MNHLVDWCNRDNLVHNINKTKEIIVDFRRSQYTHKPLLINNSVVKVVSSTKFLGVQITGSLSWSPHVKTQVKKKLRGFFIFCTRREQIFLLPSPLLFYRGIAEKITEIHCQKSRQVKPSVELAPSVSPALAHNKLSFTCWIEMFQPLYFHYSSWLKFCFCSLAAVIVYFKYADFPDAAHKDSMWKR